MYKKIYAKGSQLRRNTRERERFKRKYAQIEVNWGGIPENRTQNVFLCAASWYAACAHARNCFIPFYIIHLTRTSHCIYVILKLTTEYKCPLFRYPLAAFFIAFLIFKSVSIKEYAAQLKGAQTLSKILSGNYLY